MVQVNTNANYRNTTIIVETTIPRKSLIYTAIDIYWYVSMQAWNMPFSLRSEKKTLCWDLYNI